MKNTMSIFFDFSFTLLLSSVQADLLLVLFESSHVLASIGEISFLHAFPNLPVDESSFGVHLEIPN